jgi:hypothetical protein
MRQRHGLTIPNTPAGIVSPRPLGEQGRLSLEEHGGRTHAGVTVRVAQRLLALTAGVWHNWLIDARSLVACDH